MKCVVFLPGIMGSELRDSGTGKRVWPPRISQIIGKNLPVSNLLSPSLHATKPIATVARFYSVYDSLIQDIRNCGYLIDGAVDRRFIPFAYDWRQANERTARQLSDYLNHQQEFEEIVLLGHSMGGLILRYLLESGEFDDQPWFNKVTQLITLGTPHLGASDALKQVAGMASNTGMTAEGVKTLTSDPRYPSAYQLVPPAGSGLTLRTALRGKLPQAIDPFDDAIADAYGLAAENIVAARAFWAKLDVTRRPASVRYFSFVGAAKKTLFRLDWNGRELIEVTGKDSGDGSVPIASSINALIPHSFSDKNHATIFTDRRLRFALYKMLGASPAVVPQAVRTEVTVGASDALGLSTDKEEYAPQDSMEIGVSFTRARDSPKCTLQIFSVDESSESGEVITEVGEPIRAEFQGANVESIRFQIELELPNGVYELRAAGEVDDPQRTLFVVTDR